MRFYFDTNDARSLKLEFSPRERTESYCAEKAFMSGISAFLLQYLCTDENAMESISDDIEAELKLMISRYKNINIEPDISDRKLSRMIYFEKERRRLELYNEWLTAFIEDTKIENEQILLDYLQENSDDLVELHGYREDDLYRIYLTGYTSEKKLVNVENIDLSDTMTKEMLRAELMSAFCCMRMLLDKVFGCELNLLNYLDKDFLFKELIETEGNGYGGKLRSCGSKAEYYKLSNELKLFTDSGGLMDKLFKKTRSLQMRGRLKDPENMKAYKNLQSMRNNVFNRMQEVRKLIAKYEN